MIISHCGYACELCYFFEHICEGCTTENPEAKPCNVFTCLNENEYDNCLKCKKIGACDIMSNSIYNCPCRHMVTTSLRDKTKKLGVC